MSKKFTFIDFFSGVGGFRVAAEKNGGRSIGFSEVDKPAIAVYEKNFRTSKETAFGDITQLKRLPYADVYFGGVPCQSWSIAGSKKGFDDPRENSGKIQLELLDLINLESLCMRM